MTVLGFLLVNLHWVSFASSLEWCGCLEARFFARSDRSRPASCKDTFSTDSICTRLLSGRPLTPCSSLSACARRSAPFKWPTEGNKVGERDHKHNKSINSKSNSTRATSSTRNRRHSGTLLGTDRWLGGADRVVDGSSSSSGSTREERVSLQDMETTTAGES